MNTFELTLTIPKNTYYQPVSNSFLFEIAPQNRSKTDRKKVVNQLNVNTSGNSMTRCARREHQKQQRMARAKEYQGLLDENGWTRAELARQLGVSRAWVSTVLKKG